MLPPASLKLYQQFYKRTLDIVQELISVRALVFDLAQLTCTCQKKFDCRNAILIGSSATFLSTSSNCGSSFAVGHHLRYNLEEITLDVHPLFSFQHIPL